MSANKRWLVTKDSPLADKGDGVMRLWDLAANTWTQRVVLRGDQATSVCAVTSDGQKVLTVKCKKVHEALGPWGMSGVHTSVFGRVVSGGGAWVTDLSYRPGTAFAGAQWKAWERDWHLNAAWQGRSDGKVYAGGLQQQACRRRRPIPHVRRLDAMVSGNMDYFTYCMLNYYADGQPEGSIEQQ